MKGAMRTPDASIAAKPPEGRCWNGRIDKLGSSERDYRKAMRTRGCVNCGEVNRREFLKWCE